MVRRTCPYFWQDLEEFLAILLELSHPEWLYLCCLGLLRGIQGSFIVVAETLHFAELREQRVT
jgi:hypothetical protein